MSPRTGARLPNWSRPARFLVLGIILVISTVLQLFRINDWQTFSDDQALEMRVVHGMLVDRHLPLLGLALAVGRAHIGPLFYYLLAVPMWLGQVLVGFLDPTAGVIMVGLFQVATVYLLYRLCMLVDAPWAGLCAAGLYATSGLVVYWSRFLWPNVAPFFVVLALYALVALAQGRGRFLSLLAGSVAAAVQMQPTAVLLIPVAAIWLIAVRPRVSLRLVLLSAGLAALLLAPVIVYDLTHHFAETRAWLDYATTVQPSTAPRNGPVRGLQELEQFGWRAIGLRTRAYADVLLAAAAAAVAGCALGLIGRPRALLARVVALWAFVYLLAFMLYRGTLHPHYVEPLYPLSFLALGLLLDLIVTAPLRWRATDMPRAGPGWSYPRIAATTILGAGSAAIVVALAIANVRHLWADQFGLDTFQLDSPAEVPGNRIMLGEMRHAANVITHSAAGQSYSFLLAVRDGAGGGFAYLQRQTSLPPATTLRPLQFLLVEPASRPPWQWPPATRLRWSDSKGGFARLPHLMLWRLRLTGSRPGSDDRLWQNAADTAGEASAITVSSDGNSVVSGFIGGAAMLAAKSQAWQRTIWPSGPNGRAVIAAFGASSACPRRLYAATFDGLLGSPDNGKAWRPLPSQPSNHEILALLADPHRCGTLLAGTRAGIARTTDGGAHWQSIVVGGKRHLAIHAFARGSDGAIYAGTTDGVWMSRDGGLTWPVRRQRSEPRPALALLVHPAGTPILLAGSGAGLLYSGDTGRTWAPIGSGLHAVVYCLLDVDGHGTLLAGTDAGLYLSRNNGTHWEPTALLSGMTVTALAHGPGHEVYAASSLGVYRSTDGGITWQHA